MVFYIHGRELSCNIGYIYGTLCEGALYLEHELHRVLYIHEEYSQKMISLCNRVLCTVNKSAV